MHQLKWLNFPNFCIAVTLVILCVNQNAATVFAFLIAITHANITRRFDSKRQEEYVKLTI